MTDPFAHEDPPDLEESLEILARAQCGDGQALNDLFARYQERLLRIVRIRMGKHLRERVQSMDILQEALQVALRKLPAFQPESNASLLRWLAQIAENQIRDAVAYHQAQKRDDRHEVSLAQEFDENSEDASRPEPVAPDTAPEDRAFKRELRDILDEAVGRLPDDHREVVLLRDYFGGSWEFVAEEMGRTSIPATKQLYQRAWIRLRSLAERRLRGLVD